MKRMILASNRNYDKYIKGDIFHLSRGYKQDKLEWYKLYGQFKSIDGQDYVVLVKSGALPNPSHHSIKVYPANEVGDKLNGSTYYYTVDAILNVPELVKLMNGVTDLSKFANAIGSVSNRTWIEEHPRS